MSPTSATRGELAFIRDQLSVAASAAAICGVVLTAQSADFDHDAAIVLKQCVAELLSLQVAHLDAIIDGETTVGGQP